MCSSAELSRPASSRSTPRSSTSATSVGSSRSRLRPGTTCAGARSGLRGGCGARLSKGGAMDAAILAAPRCRRGGRRTPRAPPARPARAPRPSPAPGHGARDHRELGSGRRAGPPKSSRRSTASQSVPAISSRTATRARSSSGPDRKPALESGVVAVRLPGPGLPSRASVRSTARSASARAVVYFTPWTLTSPAGPPSRS